MREILAKSKAVAPFPEMWFLDPWHKDFRYFCKKTVGSLAIDKNVVRMVDLIFSDRTIDGIHRVFWSHMTKYNDPELKTSISERILTSDRSLGSIFKALIEETTRHRGFDRALVKFPVYPNHVPKLLEWYPKCRILHGTRDPRATAMSKKYYKGPGKYRFPQAKVLFLIIQYIWSSKVFERHKDLENYALVRYEDLLFDPEKTIRGICDFTDLEFTTEMLQPRHGKPSSLSGEQVAGFDRAPAYRWEDTISFLENKLVTTFTRRSMKRFGYDPDTHPIFGQRT